MSRKFTDRPDFRMKEPNFNAPVASAPSMNSRWCSEARSLQDWQTSCSSTPPCYPQRYSTRGDTVSLWERPALCSLYFSLLFRLRNNSLYTQSSIPCNYRDRSSSYDHGVVFICARRQNCDHRCAPRSALITPIIVYKRFGSCPHHRDTHRNVDAQSSVSPLRPCHRFPWN